MPRKPKDQVAPPPEEMVLKVASVKNTEAADVATLQAQVKDLMGQLEIERTARTAAEERALQEVENQAGSLMQTEIQERPTGKTMKIQRCNGKYKTVGYKDDGRPVLNAVFEEVDEPTYFYKIDLPPVGGIGLMLNGVYLYHGTVYEMDIHTLRTVKDSVYKCWKHDADVHGSDENAYRTPTNRVLRGGQIRTGR